MGDSNIVAVSCSNMRGWGRQALSGRWTTAVLGTIILSVLMAAPILVFKLVFNADTLEKVSDLYTFIVSGPLTLGYITFILSIFRRKSTTPIEIFYGFERFGKALGLMVVMNIFILLWTLLFIIPGIVASFRYAMAFYILADHPEMGILEIINESKRIMYGNKMKLFCLQLSFLGWALLTVFTVGIGYFWLMPYVTATTTGFYEVACGNLRPYYSKLAADNETESQ